MLLESYTFVMINIIKCCKVDDICFDLIIVDCIYLLKRYRIIQSHLLEDQLAK